MSDVVDKRIVEMQFDNRDFEKNIASTMKVIDMLKADLDMEDAVESFNVIDKAANNVKMAGLRGEITQVANHFDFMQSAAFTAFQRITNFAIDAGRNITKALIFDPPTTGFKEYETQLDAIQVIAANTGALNSEIEDGSQNAAEALQAAYDVLKGHYGNGNQRKEALEQLGFSYDEVQGYVDQIARGGEAALNAVDAAHNTTIKDIEDALDELNHYADKTIYNFTEMTNSIGTFTTMGVGLEEAVVGVKGVSNLAALTGADAATNARVTRELAKSLANGYVMLQDWKSVETAGGMGGKIFQDAILETARAQGIAVDSMIEANGSFRESLKEGWLTQDVLIETLHKFANDLTDEEWKDRGYTEEQIKNIRQLGKNAELAATQVRTASKLWDALKEAAQSTWTESWEYIVGGYMEAPVVWTAINDVIGDFLSNMAKTRNEALKFWHDNPLGRADFLKAVARLWENLTYVIGEFTAGFRRSFQSNWGKTLVDLSQAFLSWANSLYKARVKVHELGQVISTFANGLKFAWMTITVIAKELFHFITTIGRAEEASKSFGSSLDGFRKTADNFREAMRLLYFYTLSSIDNFREFVEQVKQLEGVKRLVKAFKAVGEAIDKVFNKQADNATENLKDFQKIVSKGFNFERFLPAIDIFTRLLTGLVKIGPPVINVLGVILDIFNAIGSYMAKSMYNFGQFTDKVKELAGVQRLAESLKNVSNVLRDTFGFSIVDITGKVGEFIDSFREGFNFDIFLGLVDSAANSIADLVDRIPEAIDRIHEFFASIGDPVNEENVTEGTTFIDIFKQALSGLWNDTAKIKEDVTKWADAAFDALGEWFSNVDWNQVANWGMFGALIYMIKSVTSVAKDTDSLVKSIRDIPLGLVNALTSFSKFWRFLRTDFDMLAKSQSVLNISMSIAAIAASMFLLATIPEADYTRIVAGVVTILAALIGLATVMNKKPIPQVDTKFLDKMIGIAAITAGLSLLVRSFASVVVAMDQVDSNNTSNIAIAYGLIIGALIAMAVTAKWAIKESKDINPKNIRNLSYLMISIGASMALIEGGLAAMAAFGVTPAQIGTTIGLVAVVLGGLALLMVAYNANVKMNKYRKGEQVAEMNESFVSVFKSIVKMMSGLIAPIAAIMFLESKFGNVDKAVEVMFKMMAIIATFSMLLTFVAKPSKHSKSYTKEGKGSGSKEVSYSDASKSLTAISDMLKMMAKIMTSIAVSIAILAGVDKICGPGAAAGAMAVLGVTMAILTTLAVVVGALTKIFINKDDIKKLETVKGLLKTMAIVMLGAVGAIAILALLPANKVLAAIGNAALISLVVALFGGILVGLSALTGKFPVISVGMDKLTTSMLALSLAFGVFAVSCTVLGAALPDIAAGIGAVGLSIIAFFKTLFEQDPAVIVFTIVTAFVTLGVAVLALIKLGPVVEAFGKILGEIAVAIGYVVDAIEKFVGGLKNGTEASEEEIKKMSLATKLGIASLVTSIVAGLAHASPEVVKNIVLTIRKILLQLSNLMGGIINSLVIFLLSILNGVADAIRANSGQFVAAIANIVLAIVDLFVTVIHGMARILSEFIFDIFGATPIPLDWLDDTFIQAKAMLADFAASTKETGAKVDSAVQSIDQSMAELDISLMDITSKNPIADITNDVKDLFNIGDASSLVGSFTDISFAIDDTTEKMTTLKNLSEATDNNQADKLHKFLTAYATDAASLEDTYYALEHYLGFGQEEARQTIIQLDHFRDTLNENKEAVDDYVQAYVDMIDYYGTTTGVQYSIEEYRELKAVMDEARRQQELWGEEEAPQIEKPRMYNDYKHRDLYDYAKETADELERARANYASLMGYDNPSFTPVGEIDERKLKEQQRKFWSTYAESMGYNKTDAISVVETLGSIQKAVENLESLPEIEPKKLFQPYNSWAIAASQEVDAYQQKNKDKVAETIETFKKQNTEGFTDIAQASVDAYDRKFETESNTMFARHFDNIRAKLSSMAKYIPEGLSAGINNNTEVVKASATGLADKILNPFRSTMRIASPSKVMMELGSYVTQGLAIGMTDNTAMSELKDTITTIGSIVAEDMERGINPTISPVVDMSNVEYSSGLMSGLFADRNMAVAARVNSSYADSVDYARQKAANDIYNDKNVVGAIKSLNDVTASLGDRIEGMQITIDGKATVGALSSDIDKSLGGIATRKRRGV